MNQFADDPDIPGADTEMVTCPDATAVTGIETDAVCPAPTEGAVHTPPLYPAGFDVTCNDPGSDTVTCFDGVVPDSPRNDTVITPD